MWCGGCGAVGAWKARCSACKSVRYCTSECQRSHWGVHKPLCGTPSGSRLGNCGFGCALVAKRPTVLVLSLSDPDTKPSYDDFAVSATDIGAGNFSRVMKARHRATGQPFALKVIEKAKIRRLSVRHKNMSNEIMMEKIALLKLKGHRNVVSLYHTWSDESALYFLYEFVDGGELWNVLLDDKLLVGMDYCQMRWYFLQVLDALEHVHNTGFVHRCRATVLVTADTSIS